MFLLFGMEYCRSTLFEVTTSETNWKEMRGESNSVGIVTKHFPGRQDPDYFTDDDFGDVIPLIDEAYAKLDYFLLQGGLVIFPYDGLGSGLADLEHRAPMIDTYIKALITTLVSTYGTLKNNEKSKN
tara:strand:+ start:110 stop:490 length:381 start_codon:yes stop_codon:yes gene_type:complete